MSEAACVKLEPGERCADACCARRESTHQLEEPVHVKEEPECESVEASCVKAELRELYADHEFKDELVLGPERPHRPDVGLVVQEWALGDADGCPLESSTRRGAQLAMRDCYVRLERLPHREVMHTEHAATLTTHTDSESDSEQEIQVCEKGACSICGEKFASTSDLKEHVMSHIHIPSSTELEDTENEAQSNSDRIDEKGYICDICDERFPTKLGLMEHVVVHIHLPGLEEEGDTNNDSQSNLLALENGIAACVPETTSAPPSAEHEPEPPLKPNDTSQPSAKSKIYICDTCGVSVKRKYNLIVHIKGHLKTIPIVDESKLPYKCQICNKKCGYAFNMKRHELTHTSDKPYCCDICKKSFKLKLYLKRHILSVHPTKVARFLIEKNFSHCCQTCNKGFSLISSLEKHMKLHEGVKPYCCKICMKSFSCSSTLNTHKRIHTGEKPYTCKTCFKKFRLLSGLNTHKRIHTGEKPYTCKACFKKFRKLTDLYRHERVHAGTKPHSCDICDKRFSQLPHLTEHMRVHTGEKPYSCKICKQQFRQSSTLNRHFKRTHGGEVPYS